MIALKERIKNLINFIKQNTILVNIIKIVLCGLGVFVILKLYHVFVKNNDPSGIRGTLGFIIRICLLYILPMIIAFLCRKQKGIRWHILLCAVVVIIGTFNIYTDIDNYVSYNSNDYLTIDSNFDLTAAKYLPSRERLTNSSIIYFERNDYGNGDHQMYRITAKYDSSIFNIEHNRLQKMYDSATVNELHPEENNFYLDGQFYKCFVSGHYAVAFHICKESCTISYLFFRDDINLSSMTAGDALAAGIYDFERVKCP